MQEQERVSVHCSSIKHIICKYLHTFFMFSASKETTGLFLAIRLGVRAGGTSVDVVGDMPEAAGT